MQSEHMVNEDLCCFCCRCYSSGWCEVCHFHEVIDEDYDRIPSFLSLRQLYDEVHAYMVPISRWNGQGLEESSGLLVGGFVLLALCAGCHEFSNIICHFWPVEVLGDAEVSLVETKISSQWCIMQFLH